MIICGECGHQNEAGDAFCGSCGAFLEFAGTKMEQKAPAAVSAALAEDDAGRGGIIHRVKTAVGLDDDSVEQNDAQWADRAERQRIEDERVAQAIRDKAEEEERAKALALVEADAKKAADEAEAAAKAAQEMTERAEREAEEARLAAEKAADDAARKAAEEVERVRIAAQKAAEEATIKAEHDAAEARAAAEREAHERAARAAQEAETARRNAEAEAARVAAAEVAQKAAQEELAQRAAASAAAALRAQEEKDAIRAAEAAQEAAQAQAAEARAEAEAAKREAELVSVRAQADAEAARAEAAELRRQAEDRATADTVAEAERRARERAEAEAETARRRAELDAETALRRAEAEREAAEVKAKAEAEAKAARAEAEAEKARMEADRAKARAEAEKARQDAEAAAAKRAREDARRRAESLVARPVAQVAVGGAVGVGAAGANPGGPTATPATGTASGATSGSDGSPSAGNGSATGTATVAKPSKKDGKKSPKGPGPGRGSSGGAGAARRGGDPSAVQPDALKPQEGQRRIAPKRVITREINPGDLICADCGEGNPPARKFCRKCGHALTEALVVKLSWWQRFKRKFFGRRKRKKLERMRAKAGDRPGSMGGDGKLKNLGFKARMARYKLGSSMMKIFGIVALLGMLGVSVGPLKNTWRFPTWRQWLRKTADEILHPRFDPVRADAAIASSSADPDHGPDKAKDLGNNTHWSAVGSNGQSITFRYKKPVDVDRIGFLLGANENPGDFITQPRPREVEISFNGETDNAKLVELKDKSEFQHIKLKGRGVRTITVKINSVYASDGKNVSITEVEVLSKRKYGDQFEALDPKPKVTAVSSARGTQPAFLLDENLSTSWVTGDGESGLNQKVEFRFEQPIDIERVRIAIGAAEDKTLFLNQPRPKELQVTFDDGSKIVKLKDKQGFQTVKLNRKKVSKITIIISQVHGTVINPTRTGAGIAEIEFQRKKPK